MSLKFKDKKTAEIISFFISLGIILSLFIYLGLDHVKNENSPYLEIEANAQIENIRKVGENYLVPIKVYNRGDRTPAKTVFSVEIEANGVLEESDFEVEYLPKKRSKIIYLSRKLIPPGAKVTVRLLNYQL